MDTHDPRTTLTACLIHGADLPETPPCCREAHERGYRSGYKDGYTYAFCDAGNKLSASVWQRFWHFREDVLVPWMRRSWGQHPTWEGGPRFRPTEVRHHKTDPKERN